MYIYRQAMSQRSQFIPTISHALSVSLLRNAQSPTLRRKLLSLASNPVKPPNNDVLMDLVDGVDNRPDFAGRLTLETLGRIIEGRLWVMMQHSLNHPSSTPHKLTPEDVGVGAHRAMSAGVAEMSTSGPEEVGGVMDESFSFTSYGLDFFNDDFEDLFEDMPEKGEYEEFEALFSNRMNERSTDLDFEDLLEDKPPGEPDETADAGVEEFNIDFDVRADDGLRCWGNSQNVNTGNPLGQYFTEKHDILYIENEDMLI
jgi:hypothetical protein